jgi:hypothetical protein
VVEEIACHPELYAFDGVGHAGQITGPVTQEVTGLAFRPGPAQGRSRTLCRRRPSCRHLHPVDETRPDIDPMDGQPQRTSPGPLLLRSATPAELPLVSDEVGTDEGVVLSAQGASVGCPAKCRLAHHGYVDGWPPGKAMPPGGGGQKPQGRHDGAGDEVQHVVNSDVVEGQAPGPSLAVAGVFPCAPGRRTGINARTSLCSDALTD